MNLEASERRIRDLLNQQSWRKARDEAKELCKIDRGRYLPLLIGANVGLAREMLGKKLVSEARQVIAYLKTLAPRNVWEELEAEAAMKSGDYSAAAAGALRVLDQSNAAAAPLHRTADQLVLAFQTPSSSASAAAAQAAAIQEALEAICTEEYERAAELIRPIPRDSAFRHWKQFLKGMTAFHRGDGERAARFLLDLPEDSVPGRAALPYLHWLGKADGRVRFEALPDHCREFLAALAGAAAHSRFLVRAEQLWMDGRPHEMYKLVRNGLENFPSESLDWAGTLADFCLNCLFILPPDEHGEYADFFYGLMEGHPTRSAQETKMLLRVLCLACALQPDSMFLQINWEKFLALRARIDGANPRIDSQAYEWLGMILAGMQPSPSPGFMPPKSLPRMPDAKGAVRAFQKSIEADPDNLEAQLSLAYVLGRLKRNGERNRLLDSLARRFPENKHVLFLAADRCVARKAYAKGLALLARALEQDRLDPTIPEAIVIARYLQAFQLFQRGRCADARQALDAAEALAADRSDDFMRSRWSILLRRGVLERLYGDGTCVRQDLAQARAAAPSLEAYLLTGHIVWRRYQSAGSGPDPFAAEFRQVCLSRAHAAGAVLLLRILDFWKGRAHAPSLDVASGLVRDYLKAAARQKCTREEALDLIARIPPGSAHAAAARTFIQAMLDKDGRDPLFRLHDFRYRDDPYQPVRSRRKKLNAIMKEAVRRKEDQVIQAVRHELDKLDQLPPPPPFDSPFDEFEDEEFEPQGDGVSGIMKEIASTLDPIRMRNLAEMQEMLRNASEQEIRRLRKTFPKEIPLDVFDMLLDAARDHGPDTDPRPDGQPKPRRPSKRNTAQKEFFDL